MGRSRRRPLPFLRRQLFSCHSCLSNRRTGFTNLTLRHDPGTSDSLRSRSTHIKFDMRVLRVVRHEGWLLRVWGKSLVHKNLENIYLVQEFSSCGPSMYFVWPTYIFFFSVQYFITLNDEKKYRLHQIDLLNFINDL